MWWLFKKIKGVTKRPKKLSIEEQRALYQKRKQYLTQEIKRISSKIDEEKDNSHGKLVEEANKNNNNCPHCKGTDIIHVFHKQEGNISGHSSTYLGTGGGNIYGEIETLKVNKCKVCGHEWEHEEVMSSYYSFSRTESSLRLLYIDISTILEAKYNPNDISETFNSFEEKQSYEIEKLKNTNYMLDLLSLDLSIELLAYYLNRRSYDFCFLEEDLGVKKENDKDGILYDFKPKTIKILEELGFKKSNFEKCYEIKEGE